MSLFLLIIISLFILSHVFLYMSWISFFNIKLLKSKTILGIIIAFLSLSFIGSSVLSHFYNNLFLNFYYLASAAWTGLFIYLFLASLSLWIIKIIFKKIPLSVLLGIYMLAIGYTVFGFFNASNPKLHFIQVPIKNLPSQWQGKKIVQLSDLHLGKIWGHDFLKKIKDKVNSVNPDLIVITGDLFDGMPNYLDEYLNEFKSFKSKNGIYFVSGNHEMYAGLNKIIPIIKKTNIHVLDNEVVNINGLRLVGVGFLHKDFKLEYSDLPTILLSHTPTNIGTQSKTRAQAYFEPDTDFTEAINAGVSLQLSGHTHKGQIVPLNFLTHYLFHGFDYGLHKIDNFYIYTSSGTSNWGPMIRTGSDAEIVVITLVGDNLK